MQEKSLWAHALRLIDSNSPKQNGQTAPFSWYVIWLELEYTDTDNVSSAVTSLQAFQWLRDYDNGRHNSTALTPAWGNHGEGPTHYH